MSNVENISSSDFAVGTSSDDTLTLLNDVTGVSINLNNGTNTLNLAAGANSLSNVFNVQSINGTASNDTLTLGQVGSSSGVTRVDLGTGNDTLNLGAQSFGVTFVYADNDGADVVSGFNNGNGDKIDLSGVASVHGLADVQSIASSPNGTDTVITFSAGNTLTLTGILPASLVDGDFVFAGTDLVFGDIAGSVVEAGGSVATPIPGTPTATGTLTDNATNVFTAAAAGSATDHGYGTFQMTAGGTWTYTLNDNNATVQALNSGGTLSDSFSVTTADGTAQLVTVTIHGANDAAVISGTSSGSVTEAGGVANGTPGTPTASATLTDTDVDNPANTFTAVAAGAATTNGYGTYQMTAGGTWTYTLNDNNATVQALNSGGTLSDSFTVTTADGTAQLVTVTIHGANDAAVISGTSSGSVTEAGGVANGTPGTATASATLTDTDVDNPANTFTAVAAGAATTNGYGTYQMTAGGTWTYTLNDNNATVQALNSGGTLSDSFTVTTADGTAQLVTVTIHGANDAAVISGTSSGSVTEAGGVANGTPGTPTASATLTDTDVDNPANTFTAVAAGAATTNGYGTYQMTAGGTWTYTLNDNNATVQALNSGGTLSDSFTVTTADGTAQLVTVTIHGANDAAVISGTSSGSVTEAGGVANGTPGTPTASATLTDTDVDNPANTFTAVAAGAATTNGYGTFQMTAGGTWTYTLNDNNATVQALNSGGTLSDSFTVTTADGTAQLVTVTIHGANDAPVASPVTLAVGAENTDYTITAAALLAGVTDPDGPSLSITSVSVASGGGTVVSNPDGTFTYTPVFNYSGPVSFNYTASDGSLSSSSTASLALTPLNIINGTSGPDVLLGTSQADAISGLAGNDIIKGFAGNDLIDGGTGRDIADYSDATGPTGINVDMASGTVTGNASVGTDTLHSIESVRGTDFADTYVATGFNQTSANNAQDIQIQSNINNTFEGGGGDDIITGSSGTQASYSTGNGGTQISYAHALDGVTVDLRAGTAHGTAAGDIAHVGNDSFTQVNGVVGSDFNDTLLGTDSEAHVDVFYGGKGDDMIDGRNGYDFVGYYNFFDSSVITGGISVNLATGDVIGDASVGHDTLRSIELVRGTQFDDTYTAAGYGAPGALNVSDTGTFNQFEGMGGNDTITGNGNTRVDYNFALASVTVDLQAGTGHSTVADDAGVGNDTILSGVNSIRGSSFNDFLFGSANNENFLGGYGDDLIDGRGGFDRAVYNTSADDAVTGGITVNLANGTVDGDASVGHDTLISIEAVQGTDFADTYVATGYGVSGAANVGNFGNFNEFEGGGGNDTITGNGNTRIAFYNAAAGVTVNLGAGTSFSTLPNDLAGVGVDAFTNVAHVTGSGFNDTITGNGGSNVLRGGGGDDTIDGAGGTDLAAFSGPQSAYTITFNSPSAGQIRVADSVAGRDGTDTLTNIQVLEFSDSTVLVASGTIGTPLNLPALTSGITLNPVSSLTGANDFVLVNPNINGLSIDLGAGTGDTVALAGSGFYNLNLFNVENVVGSSGDDFVSLQNHANGLAIDLGAGNNTLNLVNGSNSVSVTNVQNINGTDFNGTASNDTLTLLNDVNGVSINLAQGANTLNLAAGSNTLTNAFGVQTINGSASDDTLTFVNSTFNVTVDLGGGNDTVDILAGTGFFSSLSLFNVEHLTGSAGDDSVALQNTVSGLSVDFGTGNDSLTLANGSNSISVSNVENIGSSDFAEGTSSDDTLTLLNDVTGVSINLNNGTNTLNLAAGVNSLGNVFNVGSINGTSSADTLTLAGQVGNLTGVTGSIWVPATTR